MHYIDRFLSIPKTSFFLLGPRGTGKSTWLKATFKEALWIDLLDPVALRTYSAYPEQLESLVKGSQKKHIIN